MNQQNAGTGMAQGSMGKNTVGRVLVAGLGLACATGVHAAGFALIEQSVSDMGTAYAGAAATADSVGTLYFNPAGMTRLDGTRAGAAVHLIDPDAEFKNGGTTFAAGGAPIPGGDGGDASDPAAVPHFYLTHQLDDRTWAGLAVNAPFGLTTEYNSDWVGRYHAIKSEVKTININPSLGYKVNDRFSVALGVSAMYLEAEFSNAIDFGTLNLLPPALGGLGGALGPVGPGQADGKSTIEGDSWGWGYNIGVLFEPTHDTRIGLHYRSKVDHDIEGDVEFRLPSPLLAGTFSNTDVEADVQLPASASVSAFHQINSKWAVMADYTWTEWSAIPALRFEFDNSLPDNVTTFDWENTYRLSVGTRFHPSGSNWTYRAGVAYDESPVQHAATRTPRLPDTDRIWLTVGAGFNPGDDLRIDFGYAHLFMNDAKISKAAAPGDENFLRGALNGSYEASVDILSIEAQYTF